MAAEQWRWTDEGGVQRLLRGEELREALIDGRLRPDTLVWKRGMKSWLPAASVPELAQEIAAVAAAGVGERAARPSDRPSRQPSNIVDIEALRSQGRGGGGDELAQGPRKAVRKGGPKIAAAKPEGLLRRSNTMRDGLWAPPAPEQPEQTATLIKPRGGPAEPARAGDDDGPTAAGGTRAPLAGAGVLDPLSDSTVTNPRPLAPAAGEGRSAAAAALDELAGAPEAPPSARTAVRNAGPKVVVKARATLVSEAEAPGAGTAAAPRGQQGPATGEGRRALPPPASRRGAPPPARPSSPAPAAPAGEEAGPAADAATAPAIADASAGPLPPTLLSEPQAPAARPAPRPPVRAPAPREKVHSSAPPLASFRDGAPVRPPVEVAPPPDERRELPSFALQPWAAGDPTNAAAAAALSSALVGGHGPGAGWLQRPVLAQRWHLLAIATGASVLVILSFALGRASKSEPAGGPAGPGSTVLAAGTAPAPSAPAAAAPALRPCLMSRAPSRWAPQADHRIPFETGAAPDGKLAIGYARDQERPAGMLVDPSTGDIEHPETPPSGSGKLERVVPLAAEGGSVRFEASLVDAPGIARAVYVPGRKPFLIGFADEVVVSASSASADKRKLWALDGEGRPEALKVAVAERRGVAVTYRHGGDAWLGWLKEGGKVGHEGSRVAYGGSAGVGKPAVAHNGTDVSVVFTVLGSGGERARLFWGHAPLGKPVTKAAAVTLPAGGPGGDAIAPAVAGLPGGRWVLMWTEGGRGNRALRAQTYGPDYEPLGDALRVSPSTGDFGQGAIGVVGERVVVLFLLKARRDFEVWGTVLQCE
ncbi:MAG: DUF4339 domain-containing protein [Deltaproteobacteria bacterium]|nr:DUF4339 domain-containing protein [Deltaproteobacteria bacterium]